MLKIQWLTTVLLAVLLIQGCGSSKYLTPVSIVRPDSLQKITDEDIRKAFEARPQLVKPLVIAVYGGGSPVRGFADSLRKIPGVQSVFEISPGIIEGDGFYRERPFGWYERYVEPSAINIRQVRLVAAQGRADILIYCGASHRYEEHMNVLGATYFALIPMLFVPGMNAELRTDVDMFCIDVRDGFLYGTAHDQQIFSRNCVTLWYQGGLEDLKDEQAARCIPKMLETTNDILNNKDYFAKKPD